MDGAAIRQEIETYLHDNFIHKADIKQSDVVKHLQHLDGNVEEDEVVFFLKDLAENGLFDLDSSNDKDSIIKLPSA